MHNGGAAGMWDQIHAQTASDLPCVQHRSMVKHIPTKAELINRFFAQRDSDSERS